MRFVIDENVFDVISSFVLNVDNKIYLLLFAVVNNLVRFYKKGYHRREKLF